MLFSLQTVLNIFYFFLSMSLMGIIIILVNRISEEYKQKKIDKVSLFIENFQTLEDKSAFLYIKKNKYLFLMQFIKLQQILFLDKELEEKIIKYLLSLNLDKYYLKKLKSSIQYKRVLAASILGYLPTDEVEDALELALKKEKKLYIKVYIVNALCDLKSKKAISAIVDTIVAAPKWYQERIQVLLRQYGQDFYEYIPQIIDHSCKEFKLLILYFSKHYIAQSLQTYLIENIENEDPDVVLAACEGLLTLYPQDLAQDNYLKHKNPIIRPFAVQALSQSSKTNDIYKLKELSLDPVVSKHVVTGLSNILQRNPHFVSLFVQLFHEDSSVEIKEKLADVLSNRIDYLLVNYIYTDKAFIKELTEQVLLLGNTSVVIGFLNRNRDIELENEILAVISEIIDENEGVRDRFCTYLDQRILKKLNQSKLVCPPIIKKDKKKETSKIIKLYIYLIFILLFIPVSFLLINWNTLSHFSIVDNLKRIVLFFNYNLIFYSGAINLLYLVLLGFSFLALLKQKKYWQIKRTSTVFKKKILPTISIIAPAYNEEANIIESANSLLNLKYPDYELIIVNDGSSDQTLNTLIDYFNLERIDRNIEESIHTMPFRGIYINEHMPKLMVVDKENGGKADSLNVGINLAGKEYFCGIDSDSLLEPDSLIKLASETMDCDEKVIGLGGNILPINGCSVNKGMLTKIGIPKNHIARFQTIEYIRAFMAGRMGWSYLNCLLIISGAFGLFDREATIKAGGYLTQEGQFHKDTVGEDMELVVRLTKYYHEEKIPHKIFYAYNANCWTEVPEDFSILYRQRDRWQRGLIDILTYHNYLLLNPKYKSVGFISMPYYFVFEFLGPLLEAQGYIMVFMAAVLSLLNAKLSLMLFISSVLMGVMVSIFALIISDDLHRRFKLKELFILIFYAIIENFGLRQVLSLIRVTGYFNAMKKPKGWGKMTRKGFATTATT
jgi:peptidoglycan-N-acetylglucosamine deacetylase